MWACLKKILNGQAGLKSAGSHLNIEGCGFPPSHLECVPDPHVGRNSHSMMADEEKDYFILPKSAATGSRDALDRQLESALVHGYSVIVVEPRVLGDDIIRWIRFGNFLHKSAVVANLGCLVLLPFLSRHLINLAVIPLGLYGTTCALFYNFSWSSDPCCKYQVDHHGKELKHISSYQLSSRSPVVLVRRNPSPRLVLHTTLAMLVCGYLGWRLGELIFRQ